MDSNKWFNIVFVFLSDSDIQQSSQSIENPNTLTYYICIFFVFVCLLLFFAKGLVGKTWPSSLDIISTAFNCSRDTESEYIWLWFMGSYLYSSIWYYRMSLGVQLISVSIDSVSTLASMFRVDLLLSYYSVLCEVVY
jgi:hypothetical protein